MRLPIYMDYHATTPVDPRVVEAMLPYFMENFGNAASRHHQYGWKAEGVVENARAVIARPIRAETREIYFTSGATESNNLAIKGVAESYRRKGDHIITCTTEHNAVLDVCRRLEKQGFRVTYVPVDEYGLVDPNDIRKAITDKTILVSLMIANNEIGTIHPIETVGTLCREKDVLFHTDATQAVGKIPVDVESMNIDLMSFSAHKIYGPKGVGALYVRRRNPRVRLTAQIDGGGHENGLRSGTLNVPGIVGFGKALEICVDVMGDESKWLSQLRDR
ncbi:MAG: cysteine desulfurase family protein, partial [Bacteroidota bacterium]